MADPVNLNRFRKQKDRQEQSAKADENAVKFGRSKAEKQRQKDQQARQSRLLDQHRISADD